LGHAVRITLVEGNAEDAAEIAKLEYAVSTKLTAQHGEGPWTRNVSEKGVLFRMRQGKVFLARAKGKVIATVTLSTKKPWAIDKKYFQPVSKVLYLTSMAIAPERQRKGVGRACLKAVVKAAKEWPADAIRLDAYDSQAGAGGFYQKCGFTEVGRASYRDVPLVYYELLL
jgi:GNAT superfamily N-acetyltransferase